MCTQKCILHTMLLTSGDNFFFQINRKHFFSLGTARSNCQIYDQPSLKSRTSAVEMSPPGQPVVLSLVFLAILKSSHAFSTGAPGSTCNSMTPGHPGFSQPLPGPYSLSLSKQSYIPFEVVNGA